MRRTPISQTTIVASVARIEPVGGTKSGNPTYLITLKDGRVYRTDPDGQVNYKVQNYLPSLNVARRVQITVRGGRVINIVNADGTED